MNYEPLSANLDYSMSSENHDVCNEPMVGDNTTVYEEEMADYPREERARKIRWLGFQNCFGFFRALFQ